MNWIEFKKLAEEIGVNDDTKIYISGCCLYTTVFDFEYKTDYNNLIIDLGSCED